MFVETNGTVLEKYRLHFLFCKEKNDEIPLRHLMNLQNKDGVSHTTMKKAK